MASQPKNSFTIRPATIKDAEALTRVTIVANDFNLPYRFPKMHQYPEDFHHSTLRQFEDWMIDQSPQKWSIQVVEVEQGSIGDGEATKHVVGYAVWDVDHLAASKIVTDQRLDSRRDVNLKHYRAFAKLAPRVDELYFGKYGSEQVVLLMLMVDPEYHRQGVGSMLVDWGVDYARQRGWPVTVMASPMGKQLYTSKGFTLLGHETVRADDEDEHLVLAILERPTAS